MTMEKTMECVMTTLQTLSRQIDLIDIEKLDRIYYMQDLIKIFRVKRPETVYSKILELGIVPLPTRRLQVAGRELRRLNLI